MKRYLGNYVNLYASVVGILLVIVMIAFGISTLTSQISIETVFVFVVCLFSSIVFVFYLYKNSHALYSVGIFEENAVRVKTPFQREFDLEYAKCKDVGIGYYTHGIMNSDIGTKFYYIYLSYDRICEETLSNINRQQSSKRFVKLRYSEKTYQFLVETLPEKQSNMLKGKIQSKTGDGSPS